MIVELTDVTSLSMMLWKKKVCYFEKSFGYSNRNFYTFLLLQVVPYDSAGGRIEVFTSKGRETRSNLVIKKAGPSDSGNYTCKPSIAREASIKVHVLESKFESKDQLIYYWQ